MSIALTLGIYARSIQPGEIRTLYDAIERAADGEAVTLVRYGKRIRLVPEPVREPMVKVFSWRWKSQPPMEEIGKFVSEIFAQGRAFHMREYVPGDDCRWWIVSDHPVNDDEAERLYEAT